MTFALVFALLVETALILWLTWPDHYQPLHLAGPADDLQRAITDTRRALRRHPAPWSPSAKRHSDATP